MNTMKFLNLLLLLLLTVPVRAQFAATPEFVVHPDGAAHLLTRLQGLDLAEAPGLAVLVGTPDSVLFTWHGGLADLQSRAPISRETPFYLASIGKTFTAFAVLRLHQEGRLALDQSIADFLPQVSAVGSRVTLSHLLTHMSGIPDYYDHVGDPDGLANRDVLAFAASLDSLEFSPGTKYRYSNTAYVLLAEVVAMVSGMSYAAYLEETFFRPLGMTGTVVVDEPSDLPPHRATGWSSADDGSWTAADRASWVVGPGGIYSTLDDLYRWYSAIHRHEVVSPSLTALAFHMPATLSGQVSWMAMGWFNETFGRHDPDLQGLRVFGALGQYKGFRTMLSILPDEDLMLVILDNSGDYRIGAGDVARAFLRPMVYGNTALPR